MTIVSHPAGRPGRLVGAPARALRWCWSWWLGAGVQIRSTIAAIVVLALVILIAGCALVLVIRQSVDNSLDASNSATAEALESLVTEGVVASPVNIAAGGDGRFGPGDLRLALDGAAQRGSVVQILNGQGQVVASSRDMVEAPALFFPEDLPPLGELSIRERWLRFDVDPYRFMLHTSSVSGQRYTVVVGQSLGPGQRTLQAVVIGLAVVGPLLLLAVAAATYAFIGRSLRPVTRIRTTVEGITHHDLTERVPVPPGRDEVAELARTMNAMLVRLDRATQAQRQFVSDASHELRSPIATLRAGADIALAVPGRVSQQELATLVRAETARLESLVADLLLLARLDENPGQLTDGRGVYQEVDLDDLVTAEALRLRTSTHLRVEVLRQPVRLLGYPHDFARLLRNLTDNAVRHAESRVGLSLRAVESAAVLEISNDGDPIPVADRERIFERFVRLEESRSRDLGGSGLGLAIVREIVTAYGGSVQVVDPPAPMATCLRVRLPIPADEAGPVLAAPAETRDDTLALPGGRPALP